MAELLKNKYNHQLVNDLAMRLKNVYPGFDGNKFVNDIFDKSWDKLELKQRIRKIAVSLGTHLPSNYEKALTIIDQVLASYPSGFNDFTLMYFPDFIEVYGQKESDWDLSIAALARYTQSSSSEFAVRPFIIKNQKRMMEQMLIWSKDDNQHVRRLASEGCRPRLPWAQALTSFKKNPRPIFNILEQLKLDNSLYVRKSVANNLNDIAKSHPDLVIKIAHDWYGNNQHTDWILKHGCRTLLKKGNKQVLKLFGFEPINCVTIKDFTLDSNTVYIGEYITFSFTIETKQAIKLRLEYAINYIKANGVQSRKIFQISEIALKANSKKFYTKKHRFANLSSRKHYPGIHALTLIVNGNEWQTLDFNLLAESM